MAFDPNIEPVGGRRRGNGGNVAVIDRFLKPAFGGAALEPGKAPMCDRLMRHIGVHINTGHQSAAEPEAAGHRIVVDLVFRRLCGVEGFGAIGGGAGSGHDENSWDRRSGLHRDGASAILSVHPRRQIGDRAMDSHLPEYELYAIRYAERDARRSDHFIGGDPHDGPMPMDYFVWAAIGPERSFVIDTGFTAEVAAARGRRHLRCPAESLSLVGL